MFCYVFQHNLRGPAWAIGSCSISPSAEGSPRLPQVLLSWSLLSENSQEINFSGGWMNRLQVSGIKHDSLLGVRYVNVIKTYGPINLLDKMLILSMIHAWAIRELDKLIDSMNVTWQRRNKLAGAATNDALWLGRASRKGTLLIWNFMGNLWYGRMKLYSKSRHKSEGDFSLWQMYDVFDMINATSTNSCMINDQPSNTLPKLLIRRQARTSMAPLQKFYIIQ